MIEADQIGDYLQRLTPLARSNLLSELERLEVCGAELPGTALILEKLRAEFRKSGQTANRVPQPSRYFFAPLEPLLVDGAPEHANSGRIQRGSLSPIWEWISRDLLPMMTRDYVSSMNPLISSDNQRGARQVVAAFQTKVVKYLESTLGSPNGVEQTHIKLATYTASRAAFGDLTRIMSVLRVRDALGKFDDALPATITEFDDAQLSRIMELLEPFREIHPQELAFALALVVRRLKTPWQLIRLATRTSPSKNAEDIAASPYAITVSMVLDRLDDWRLDFRAALKADRVIPAKEILTDVYDTEYALQVRIDRLEQSEWGQRLHQLMEEIAKMVEAEVSRFPDTIGHVLGSRSLRSHQSLSGRLTYLAWKGRDAITDGAAYCKKLVSPADKPRG
jgi:hypothetical protein